MRRLLLAALPLLALAACQATPGARPATRTVVFFNGDSAAIDENASTLIGEVAERAKGGSGPVRIRGFAAPDSGTAAFNRALAQARAQNVADVLVAGGVERSRIRLESRGAVPFEMFPTESRRVEMLVGE